MSESELLDHIAARSAGLAARFGQVVVGPGDDCAVVRMPGGGELLLTVDHVVEGRHVEPGTPVDLIARKAVARSVSDIAAMGGTPAWSLATGCLPKGDPRGNELFDAMHRWANHWGCPIIGGDIATSDGPMVLTVTVGGLMDPRSAARARGVVEAEVDAFAVRAAQQYRPVLRSGAQPGDEVWVSGPLGGSLASGRHLAFEPRLAVGQQAAWAATGVHAMLDISDGLGRDAGRLARASGVVIEIDADLIPLAMGASGWEAAVRDGEDYELLMAIAPAPEAPVVGAGLVRIGVVRACAAGEHPGAWVRAVDGQRHEVSDWGWEHR